MTRAFFVLRFVVLAAAVMAVARPSSAHPIPFSYLDLHIEDGQIEGHLVAHIVDLSHELNIEPPERLLNSDVAIEQAEAMAALVERRLELFAPGQALSPDWLAPEVLLGRQAIRLNFRYRLEQMPGTVSIATVLFPYDPRHQTFLNVYEGGDLRQQSILDAEHPEVQYFLGTWQGTRAVVQKFLPVGVHHIITGTDHLLFLFGLLLLGGSIRQLLTVITAFTVAHSITLSLSVLGVFSPPANIVEPVIALSVVWVGADNLLVGSGRDMRAWIAFVFGLIHGFGFAGMLTAMELPGREIGWSLASFNVGVELGQIAVAVVAASALGLLRSRSQIAARRLAVVGSIVVIVAGGFWFIERVFFPFGIW